jgi:hypothetical protein
MRGAASRAVMGWRQHPCWAESPKWRDVRAWRGVVSSAPEVVMTVVMTKAPRDTVGDYSSERAGCKENGGVILRPVRIFQGHPVGPLYKQAAQHRSQMEAR